MKTKHIRAVIVLFSIGVLVRTAQAADIYVDCQASTGGDGHSWGTAFRTIQEGVDAASTSGRDTVHVAPGVYDAGETAIMEGKKAAARVAVIGKSVKILSRDGKAATHIVGRRGDGLGGPNADGDEPVMCVFVNATAAEKNTVIEGFTIRDGELTADFVASGPAGVGSPLVNAVKYYSPETSNDFYVAYCTISNCCAQRASAMRGGTAIATLFADNHSWMTNGDTENAMYVFAYNSIFARSGAERSDGNNPANTYLYDLVNCTFVDNLAERGATLTGSACIYNTAVVDNGKAGMLGGAGVYNCVGDGDSDPSKVFYSSGDHQPEISDTVSLSTLVTSAAAEQTQHRDLFVAASMGDFRPIDGGYLYGKDGHYGRIEYTRLGFIPSEYKQRDFFGQPLEDDACIPIGAILPAVTPAARPIKVSAGMTIDGVSIYMNGGYVWPERADDVFQIGIVRGSSAVSAEIDGVRTEFLLPNETVWCRPGGQASDLAVPIGMNAADGVFYVDRDRGSDDECVTGGEDAPFQSIQRAVGSVPDGKKYVIYVSEGTYDNGGVEVPYPGSEKFVRACVVLTNGCGSAYVRALGRREETVIEGAYDPGSADGSGQEAYRIAVSLPASVTLAFSGFTFRKGRVDSKDSDPRSRMGGGFLATQNAKLIVMDSDVTDCAAANYSAGYFSTFVRCRFKGNKTVAGAETSPIIGNSVAAFCVFEDNSDATSLQMVGLGSTISAASFLGLLNCTIYTPTAATSAQVRGASGPLANTIVLSPAKIGALKSSDYSDVTSLAYGCSDIASGLAIKVANPRLKDPTNGDYRPNWNSPAWQAGTLLDKFRSYMIADFNGNPVDISRDGTKVTLGAVHTLGKRREGLMILFR